MLNKSNEILTEKEDIIIALTDYLENSGKAKLTIRYTALDKKLEFIEDSTKKYLEEVADKIGFEIESQTESQAVLVKKATPSHIWL